MANFIPTNVDDGNNQIVKLIAGASFDTKTLYFDRALFSFEVNDALPITIKAFDPTTNTQERITIPAGGLSADMKSATGVKRGIAPNGTDITTESATFGANLSKGTHIFPIVSPQVLNQIVGAMDGTTNISPKFGSAPTWDTTQSNVAASMPVYANAATGQAAITSPVNGYKFYATAEGVIYKYEAGSWTTEGSSTTANASETVAGKSQIATTAQVDDGDTVGSTGAPIVLTPDKLNPKNLTNTKATIADGDSTMISNSEAGGALVKVLYSTIKTFFQSGLTFLGLADTPASYSGLGGKLLRVNAAENAVESVEENPSGVGIDNTGRMVSVVSQFTLSTFVNIGSGFGNVSAGAGSGWANIPSVSAGNIYQTAFFETGKIIEAEWAMKFLVNSSTPIRFSVGIGQQATYHSETTLSGAYGARFVLNGTGFYAVTSNNSTVTSVLIDTLTHNTRYFKKFKIIYDLANNAKFYVDETLVATISTSLVANNLVLSTFGLALTGATGEVSCFFPVIRQTI